MSKSAPFTSFIEIELSLEAIEASIANWRQQIQSRDLAVLASLNRLISQVNPIVVKQDMFSKWKKNKPDILNVHFGLSESRSEIFVILVDSTIDAENKLNPTYITVLKPVLRDGLPPNSDTEIDIAIAQNRINAWRTNSGAWLSTADEIFAHMRIPFEDFVNAFNQRSQEVHLYFALNNENAELIVVDENRAVAWDVSTPVPPFPSDSELYIRTAP